MATTSLRKAMDLKSIRKVTDDTNVMYVETCHAAAPAIADGWQVIAGEGDETALNP
jgi:hypothetical protein